MKPPTSDDILVSNGNGRLYAVKFKDGKPYPWNKITGHVWRVKWKNWEEVARLPLDTHSSLGGSGGMGT